MQARSFRESTKACSTPCPGGVEKPVWYGLELASDVGCNAPSDVHYAHALSREIREIALQHEQWKVAEEFAVHSLMSVPCYGTALKVRGLALRGQGKFAEAAVFHRYGLPNNLRKWYFTSDTYRPIHSDESSTVKKLPIYPSQIMSLVPPVSVDTDQEWELAIAS